MTTSLSDLLAPRSFAEIRAAMRADFDARLVALGMPAASPTWLDTTTESVVLDVCAAMVSYGDNIAARLARAQSRSHATKDLLKSLAQAVYGVTPTEDTPAAGYVLVSTTGATFWVQAGVDRFRNKATGALYTATESMEVPSGGSASVPVVGPAPGTAFDTGPSTVTEMVITRTGASCTNLFSIVGTRDEGDAALQRRMQLAPIARQPQPTNAKFEFEALNVAAHGVPVNRVRVFRAGADVRVVASTAAGGLSAPQLAALNVHLINHVLGSSGLFVLDSATTLPLAATARVATLWVPSTDARTDAVLVALASQITATLLAECPIGGYRRGAISGFASDLLAARLVSGMGLVDVDNLPPDVVMTLGTEVPTVGALTFEVRRAT